MAPLSQEARRARWAAGLAAVALLLVAWLSDRDGFLFSALGVIGLLRWLGLFGLLVLGQQAVRRAGAMDLGTGGQIALASVLSIGLVPVLGEAGAVAAAGAVALVIGVSVAAVLGAWRVDTALVTLVPAALAAAALPQDSSRPAPELANQLANGTLGMLLPWLLVFYLGALVLALAAGPLRRRWRWEIDPAAAVVVAFGGASLLWALLGVQWAGALGVATTVPLWPPLLGLGTALLLAPRGLDDYLAGALAATALALTAHLVENLSPAAALAMDQRVLPLLAAMLLLGGLARRRLSTDADDLHPDTVDRPGAGIDDQDDDGPPLARSDTPDGDGPLSD